MLYNEYVTVKQLVYLLISCGFRKCELWTHEAYINANHKSKEFRSHRIATKKMDLLHEAGMDYKNEQKFVLMEGKQKVNKTNLSLLGEPLWNGTIEELDILEQRNLDSGNLETGIPAAGNRLNSAWVICA